jgi:hypothetical protein
MSCHHSCGPSDWYRGGKCDLMGCYYEGESKEKYMEQQFEERCNSLLSKMKAKDPQFELKAELGKLLMKHINDFTTEEKKRYDELLKILK